MLCSLINKKHQFFCEKKPTGYNPNSFWIVAVQDWFKTSHANVVRALGTLNVIDIDNLLVKKKKLNDEFLIIIKLAKNVKIFNYRILSTGVEVGRAPF